MIGGSNRGGRRIRRKTLNHSAPDGADQPTHARSQPGEGDQTSILDHDDNAAGYPGALQSAPGPAIMIDPALQPGETSAGPEPYLEMGTRESSAGVGNIAFNDLQNPSDALGILAQVASNGQNSRGPDFFAEQQHELDYLLVKQGKLALAKIAQLVQRYKQNYHPYFPLVPAHTLDVANLVSTAREERHLLTAILVISSRDLADEPSTFLVCSEHMRTLVSALAAGGSGNVEAVEALLLLAEWTPYTSRSDAGYVGRGEEDREAWMHVGTALRVG